ncbi:MAG: dienelactone hydrolase [Actinomycetota bacterium]|nr:dienelactone hydrolase [Actinomycetota bacterium]
MSPTRPPRAGLVLAPGASATRDHPSLVVLDDALTAEGLVVERIDLPSSRPGPKVLGAVADAAGALAARAGLPPQRILLGGRSLGGRVCSMAVAGGLPALGLVLISYPLHPPGRPEVARTEHLPALDLPCLFVSGTRDAFATPDELQTATGAIPGPVAHAWIDGGDHGLRHRDVQVGGVVRDWVLALLGPRD